jgi:peptidoglycan hydrolase CwlO-like protein
MKLTDQNECLGEKINELNSHIQDLEEDIVAEKQKG